MNTSAYFEFNEETCRYLEKINEDYDKNLSPYAAKNADVIRRKGAPRYDIIRPAYAYDVDLILHHPLYNRYTDKTQVFSFYRNDDLSRRALHVQLVSKIARTIGRALKLNLDLIEAIALGHDIGHTPFGHKGEEFLSECYQEGTKNSAGGKRYFNHNVHSAKIFRYIFETNISVQTLSGIISHNGEKLCREYEPMKLSGFDAFDEVLENCYVDNDFHRHLRPNTLEGCVVRISDMVAYAGKDRQDLYRAKLVPEKQFRKERLIGTSNRDIISRVIINLIKNSLDSPSLNMDEEVFEDLRDLIQENYDVIYGNKELNDPYYQEIRPLMHKLYKRLIEDVESLNMDSPVFLHYLNDRFQGKSYYNDDRSLLIADANEIVTDYIASMTDDYFVDVCEYLHIDDELRGRLKYHGYFE